jgi:hypothetical protein
MRYARVGDAESSVQFGEDYFQVGSLCRGGFRAELSDSVVLGMDLHNFKL